jgi:hypothetical protein
VSKPIQTIPAPMREKYDAIMAMIEPFCRDRLNDEYLDLCRKLAGTLARKRPSPLVNGTPAAWACGIIRVIGWVNFLDDRTQQPHMKMTEVDAALGVSIATGQARSKAIRDLLKFKPFDPQWTLPSRMDDNPMAWLVQVNGMIVDVRHLPREIQEEAFERGMIPYLPGEGDASAQDKDPEKP